MGPEVIPDPPYAFKYYAGVPIQWQACLTMRWSYNPAGEPSPGAIEVVREAMADIGDAAGIKMEEVGVTNTPVSDANQLLRALSNGEVVIGYASPDSPALVNKPEAAGAAVSTLRGADLVSGVVVIDSVDARTYPTDFSSSRSLGAVVLHEIGHNVGLQHVGPTQIMQPVMSRTSPGRLGTGDLAGLATLKNRCVTTPVHTTPDSTLPPDTTVVDTTPTVTAPDTTVPDATAPDTTTTEPPATTTEPATTTALPTDTTTSSGLETGS